MLRGTGSFIDNSYINMHAIDIGQKIVYNYHMISRDISQFRNLVS